MDSKRDKLCKIFAILMLPMYLRSATATNIDCGGKPFHCVNSTHFMICVDLGAGISKTVDELVIQCPATTVCRESNYFECEYQLQTTTQTINHPDDKINDFTTDVTFSHGTTNTIIPTQKTSVTSFFNKYYNKLNISEQTYEQNVISEVPETFTTPTDIPTTSNDIFPLLMVTTETYEDKNFTSISATKMVPKRIEHDSNMLLFTKLENVTTEPPFVVHPIKDSMNIQNITDSITSRDDFSFTKSINTVNHSTIDNARKESSTITNEDVTKSFLNEADTFRDHTIQANQTGNIDMVTRSAPPNFASTQTSSYTHYPITNNISYFKTTAPIDEYEKLKYGLDQVGQKIQEISREQSVTSANETQINIITTPQENIYDITSLKEHSDVNGTLPDYKDNVKLTSEFNLIGKTEQREEMKTISPYEINRLDSTKNSNFTTPSSMLRLIITPTENIEPILVTTTESNTNFNNNKMLLVKYENKTLGVLNAITSTDQFPNIYATDSTLDEMHTTSVFDYNLTSKLLTAASDVNVTWEKIQESVTESIDTSPQINDFNHLSHDDKSLKVKSTLKTDNSDHISMSIEHRTGLPEFSLLGHILKHKERSTSPSYEQLMSEVSISDLSVNTTPLLTTLESTTEFTEHVIASVHEIKDTKRNVAGKTIFENQIASPKAPQMEATTTVQNSLSLNYYVPNIEKIAAKEMNLKTTPHSNVMGQTQGLKVTENSRTLPNEATYYKLPPQEEYTMPMTSYTLTENSYYNDTSLKVSTNKSISKSGLNLNEQTSQDKNDRVILFSDYDLTTPTSLPFTDTKEVTESTTVSNENKRYLSQYENGKENENENEKMRVAVNSTSFSSTQLDYSLLNTDKSTTNEVTSTLNDDNSSFKPYIEFITENANNDKKIAKTKEVKASINPQNEGKYNRSMNFNEAKISTQEGYYAITAANIVTNININESALTKPKLMTLATSRSISEYEIIKDRLHNETQLPLTTPFLQDQQYTKVDRVNVIFTNIKNFTAPINNTGFDQDIGDLKHVNQIEATTEMAETSSIANNDDTMLAILQRKRDDMMMKPTDDKIVLENNESSFNTTEEIYYMNKITTTPKLDTIPINKSAMELTVQNLQEFNDTTVLKSQHPKAMGPPYWEGNNFTDTKILVTKEIVKSSTSKPLIKSLISNTVEKLSTNNEISTVKNNYFSLLNTENTNNMDVKTEKNEFKNNAQVQNNHEKDITGYVYDADFFIISDKILNPETKHNFTINNGTMPNNATNINLFEKSDKAYLTSNKSSAILEPIKPNTKVEVSIKNLENSVIHNLLLAQNLNSIPLDVVESVTDKAPHINVTNDFSNKHSNVTSASFLQQDYFKNNSIKKDYTMNNNNTVSISPMSSSRNILLPVAENNNTPVNFNAENDNLNTNTQERISNKMSVSINTEMPLYDALSKTQTSNMNQFTIDNISKPPLIAEGALESTTPQHQTSDFSSKTNEFKSSRYQIVTKDIDDVYHGRNAFNNTLGAQNSTVTTIYDKGARNYTVNLDSSIKATTPYVEELKVNILTKTMTANNTTHIDKPKSLGSETTEQYIPLLPVLVDNFNQTTLYTKLNRTLHKSQPSLRSNYKPIGSDVTEKDGNTATHSVTSNGNKRIAAATNGNKTHSRNTTNVNMSTNRSFASVTPFRCNNHLRGRFGDRSNCRKYYICIGKYLPVLGQCPSNTVFSEIKKQCTKNLSHCIRNHQFRCTQKGRFSDVLRTNIYYICVNYNKNYIRFQFQCQNGFSLNKTSVKCENNMKFQSRVTSMSLDNDSNKGSDQSTVERKSKERKEYKKDAIYICNKEGKFPDAEDCRRYYVCYKNSKMVFRRRTKKCDSDEVFHREKKKCVDRDSYECN